MVLAGIVPSVLDATGSLANQPSANPEPIPRHWATVSRVFRMHIQWLGRGRLTSVCVTWDLSRQTVNNAWHASQGLITHNNNAFLVMQGSIVWVVFTMSPVQEICSHHRAQPCALHAG